MRISKGRLTHLIGGQQNHILLKTFYIKNNRELDIKVQGPFKEERISYHMSKFELPKTSLMHFASIEVRRRHSIFFVIFENRSDLYSLMHCQVFC